MALVTVKVDEAAAKKLRVALAYGLGELARATVEASLPGKPEESAVETSVFLDGAWLYGEPPGKVRPKGMAAFAAWGFPARFVEMGTAAHDIAPKDKEALAFGGEVRGTVHHPGAHRRQFINPALATAMGHSEASLRAGIGRRWS